MKKTTAAFLTLIFLLAILPDAYADQSQQNAVCELYSVDGYYEDDVGNQDTYSYHVPQINADTPAAKEINTEIAEHFGKRVEHEFQNMEGSFSLVSWHTGWQAYWSGSQLFLLITSDNNGDMMEYGAYGYDFETGDRVTNEMVFIPGEVHASLYNTPEGALMITVHTTAVEDEMTLMGGTLHVAYNITVEGLGTGRIDYWLSVRPKHPPKPDRAANPPKHDSV